MNTLGWMLLALLTSEVDASLEKDTPGAWEPTAVRFMRESHASAVEQAHTAWTAPREDTARAWQTAIHGNEDGEEGGLVGAWTEAGVHGATARDRAAATFTEVPEVAAAVGQDARESAARVGGEFPAAWERARARFVADAAANRDSLDGLGADLHDVSLAADTRVDDAREWALDLADGLEEDTTEREHGIERWAGGQMRSAWQGMSVDAPTTLRLGWACSALILGTVGPTARDTLFAGNAAAVRQWNDTREATSSAWQRTGPEAKRTWLSSSAQARAVAGWLADHALEPVLAVPSVVRKFWPRSRIDPARGHAS